MAFDAPACQSDDPEYCICNLGYGCSAIPAPYPTQYGATCVAWVYERPLWWTGWTESHTYTITATKVGSQIAYETFDAGPAGSSPGCCGYLNAWAQVGPSGHLSGDDRSQLMWWNTLHYAPWGSGWNATTCEMGVLGLQQYEFLWPQNYIIYALGKSPNSNTYTSESLIWVGATIPTPPNTPGWATQ